MMENLPALNRRRFLSVAGGAAAVVGLAACGKAAGGSGGGSGTTIKGKSVRWISPRGTLEVLDDYPFWVARKMGYFQDVQVSAQGGPLDATGTVKFVDQNEADMGYPSPGVLSLALAQGLQLVSVFQMGAVNPFDIAVPKGSPIKTVQDLKGKTIALGSAGWQSIVDPILSEGGLDPKSVKYVEAGNSWPQALKQGKTDAAISWEGLRAQWLGQGLDFDYIMGQKFSKFPGNSFVVRRADFQNQASRELLTRYLRGWAMGLEFGLKNPRAATQLTLDQFPALKKQMKPDVAVHSFLELANTFHANFAARGNQWGAHSTASWDSFFSVIHKIGQVDQTLSTSKYIHNDLIAGANQFDHNKVAKDAAAYPLPPEMKAVDVAKIQSTLIPS
jgi:NitT/TauT family transport system substrate-binding protein